jgi:hypothetical protein
MANKLCFSLLLLTGCAAKLSSPGDEAAQPDASQAARTDAAIENPPPQHLDAGTTPSDGCTTQVTQLLANPAFDGAPLGTGWTAELIDPNSPLITDEDGVVEHTPPYKAWLGGIDAPAGYLVTDWLVQTVTIPANTTHLAFTGMYDVRTAEAPTTSEFDTADILVTELDGTVIQSVLAVSNATPKTAWASFDTTITPNLSGKMVRVYLTSTSDELDPTSFYFDSLALNATHACATAL